MHIRIYIAFLMVVAIFSMAFLSAAHASNGQFSYPVQSKEVVQNFVAPKDEYSAGHRGVDFKANIGDRVFAVAPGRVIFAGLVAGKLHVTIDHGSKIVSTYTFLASKTVSLGDLVEQGKVIGAVGVADQNHASNYASGSFHFSMRANDKYVDPLKYLNSEIPLRKIALVPLQENSDSFLKKLAKKEKNKIIQAFSIGKKALSGSDDFINNILDYGHSTMSDALRATSHIYEEMSEAVSDLKIAVKDFEKNAKNWSKKKINQIKDKIRILEKKAIDKTKKLIKHAYKLAKQYQKFYKDSLKHGIKAAHLFLKYNAKTAYFLSRLRVSIDIGIIDGMKTLAVTSKDMLAQWFDVDWDKLLRTIVVPITCLEHSCIGAIELSCDPTVKFNVNKKNFVGTKNSVMIVSGLQSSGNVKPLKADNGSGERVGQPTNIPWKTLGYNKEEINYFSYAGGNKSFEASDTYQDLKLSAKKMDEQIRLWKQNNPGKKLDLITHSLGGAVVATWLALYYEPDSNEYPQLGKVIMFAPPLVGSQLTDSGEEIDSSKNGKEIHDYLSAEFGEETIPPSSSIAIKQLRENGELEEILKTSEVTKKIKIHTIRSASDAVVTSGSSTLPGAQEIIINTNTFNPVTTHTSITTDAQAISTAQRILEGKKPPCLTPSSAAKSIVSSAVVHGSEVAIAKGARAGADIYGEELLEFISVATN